MRIYSEEQIMKALDEVFKLHDEQVRENYKDAVNVALHRRKNFEDRDEPFNPMEKHYLEQAMNTYEKAFAEEIREENKKSDRNHLLGENFAKVIFHDVRLKLNLK